MFSACIFCHASLGTNEAIEAFPIGSRLAFDPERGRLWVICRHCRQWNLTPMEERWEAVEQCERRFRDTRVRVSTDQIGLARLREGLDLVRIGRPLRPEFAAWRYGEQLGRRRRRALAVAGGAALVGGAAVVGGALAGLVAVIPGLVLLQARGLPNVINGHRVVARIPAGKRYTFPIRGRDLAGARVETTDDDTTWALRIRYDGNERRFVGTRALRAASHLMAGVNRFGASRDQVTDAVSLLDDAGDPDRFFLRVARKTRALGRLAVPDLPAEVRLAIEMSAHEESERRAMAGELAELKEAWEAAEAVAAIADDMFLPTSFADFARRHRRDANDSRSEAPQE